MQRLQGVVAGLYDVEREVDRGGRGAVYRARDTRHDRDVAIKVMLPEVADAIGVHRFLQEISIAARLNHPHILPLYDSGQADGLIYYVMPFVAGKSLKDRLDQETRLPLKDVTRITGEVASALDRAHREGVIHRDIKPANILLVGNHAAVTDFGIARAIDAAENLAETGTGVFIGTGTYMSPEQASGATDLDGRTDLYSLGCTVFEMLAGHPPFPGPTLRQVLTQHIVSPVPSLRGIRSEIPEHVDEAVTRALAKEPSDRFDTLIDFANALNHAPSQGLWDRLRSMRSRAGAGAAGAATPTRPVAADAPRADSAARVRPCPSCEVENENDSRFCRECGASLADATDATGIPEGPAETEVRQLTVLYSDTRSVIDFADRLDPAMTTEVVHEYRKACVEAVRRFDGHIVQADDHSVVAYFGYPVAHEDDPVRAGLASMQIVDTLAGLGRRLEQAYEEDLNVRIGIHTGPALMDVSATPDLADGARLATGDTPRTAEALRNEAPSDGILVSDVTYRLFKGYFTCQEMGIHEAGADGEPVLSYRLLGESGVGRLLESTRSLDLPPLVGREDELAAIMGAWAQAAEGTARLTLVEGEAGIGKSRLLAAARKTIGDLPHVLLEAGCSPYDSGTALYAVVRLFEHWLGTVPGDSDADRFEALRMLVPQYTDNADVAVPLLAALLEIPPGDATYEPLEFEPAHQRRKTLEVLLAMVRAAAEQKPVLIMIDDLQWVDPSTLEFLNMCLDRARTSRIMLLVAGRPAFSSPWTGPHVTTVTLGGLADSGITAVVNSMTGGLSLPQEVLGHIVQRADGIPLFAEETIRTLLEAGHLVETDERYELATALGTAAIPPTLRDALASRVDQLGTAKSVVQLGAVIGRYFQADLLMEVSGVDDWVALGAELGRAVDAGVLESSGAGAQATYRFRHALVQEHAYHSLIEETRRGHHRRIMEALERSAEAGNSVDAAHLAFHSTEAGEVRRAIPHWRRAGQQATAGAALEEAVGHLQRGLELLSALPEGSERDLEEMELQRTLGAALQALKGYAAPEVSHAYARARELCTKGGAAERLLPVLWGQHMYHTVRAAYGVSEEIARDMLALAEDDGHAAHHLVSNLALALSHLYLGELVEAREEFRTGIGYFSPDDWPRRELFIGEPRTVGDSYLARTLWILGEVDEAVTLSHRSLSLARRLSEPSALVQALGMHTILLLLHRDNAQAQEYATETVEVATRHGFAYWQVLGSMFGAILTAQRGEHEAGIATFTHCLALYENQGAQLGLSWFRGALARMHIAAGDPAKASALLESATFHIEETDERYYEAEILRLRGEVALASGADDAAAAAEAAFVAARDLARRQHAGSWELRAAVSLASLYRAEGRLAEAREALDMVEGMPREFDPPADHRDARQLLDDVTAELGSG